MAQIECGRGHLYDPDKYPTCPYCGGQRITVASAGRTTPIGRPVTAASRTAPVGGTPVTAAQKTAPLSGVSVTAPQKTAPLSGISVTAPQKTMPPRGYGVPAPEPVQTAPPPGMGVSVAAAGKTVGMMQSQMGFDPVVGWLACVAGPSRGKSYTIRGGVNAIGRSERMDIVITGDLKISAENHAKISYSDKHNRFNLLPGEGRNIIYLNDEEVFTPMPLKAYDLIDFGETKLLFVPLCGERFTWRTEERDGTV
ncbi:MAG: FHA domain-containing protein [Lawsonibacter sp.]|nr:FHA domain-containing protein [Lawsonibacter sp.]